MQFVNNLMIDYKNSTSSAKVPEVLVLITVILRKRKEFISSLPIIIESLFQTTIEIISNNYEDFPLLRFPFYNLIDELVTDFCPPLIEIMGENFSSIVQIICYGIQHPQHDICEKSFEAANHMCRSIASLGTEQWSQFLSTFFLDLILTTFQSLIDTVHKFAFDSMVDFLIALFKQITDPESLQLIVQKLMEMFPNRNPDEVFQHIKSMFEASKLENTQDKSPFRQAVRDFLVMTRHFKPFDPALYKEEKEKEQAEIDAGYLNLNENDFLD